MDRLTHTLRHWQAQGGMVALGGHRLFVAQAGQHGSVLLLIHGYPTSSYDWHPLWAPLAMRYRLIAPDLLGMGFSDKPADHAYGIENHADLLEALLDRLGVQQVHIVAHDLGVSVAQEMLARRQAHPLAPRIQSLTLLNGGVCPEAYQPRMLQHLLSSPLGHWIAPRIPKQAFERTITRLFGPHTLPSPALLQDFWVQAREQMTERQAPGRLKQWVAMLTRTYPEATALFTELRRETDCDRVAQLLGVTAREAA